MKKNLNNLGKNLEENGKEKNITNSTKKNLNFSLGIPSWKTMLLRLGLGTMINGAFMSGGIITDKQEGKKDIFKSKNIEFHENKNFPLNIIVPGYLTTESKTGDKKDQKNINVPQEYAREFDLGKALDSTDYDKAKEYIRNILIENIDEVVFGYNRNKEMYKENNEIKKDTVHITGIDITGYASPEASKYGPESLKPGNKEKENQILAKEYRAENTKEILLESIKEIKEYYSDKGIIIDIDISNITTSGIEKQFTEENIANLDTLAQQTGYGSGLEGIYHMIIAYNNGEFEKDPDITKTLYDNCGKYRTVDITIHSKINPEKVYTFPISVFVLLPYLLMFLKRRKKSNTSGKTIHINENGKLTDEDGHLINKKGQLINKDGQLINENGHIVNKKGQLINEDGHIVNENGKPIDDDGQIIKNPPVIPPLQPILIPSHEKKYVPREIGNKENMNRKDRPYSNKQPRNDRESYFFNGGGTNKRKHSRKGRKD